MSELKSFLRVLNLLWVPTQVSGYEAVKKKIFGDIFKLISVRSCVHRHLLMKDLLCDGWLYCNVLCLDL